MKKSNNNLLLKYAGLSTQLFIALGLAVYLGIKADKWLSFKTPLFVWILPLIIIAVIMYKIIKDFRKNIDASLPNICCTNLLYLIG
jgi:hypothetical protein